MTRKAKLYPDENSSRKYKSIYQEHAGETVVITPRRHGDADVLLRTAIAKLLLCTSRVRQYYAKTLDTDAEQALALLCEAHEHLRKLL